MTTHPHDAHPVPTLERGPGRFVDSDSWGWRWVLMEDGSGGRYARQDSHLPDTGPLTAQELAARFGPMRAVATAAPPGELEEAGLLLERAGRKALVTTAVALRQVMLADMKAHSAAGRSRGPVLTCGDPGGLNGRAVLAITRDLGGETGSHRVAWEAVAGLVPLITSWVTGAGVYVEPGHVLGRALGLAAVTAGGGHHTVTDGSFTGLAERERIRQWLTASGAPDTPAPAG